MSPSVLCSGRRVRRDERRGAIRARGFRSRGGPWLMRDRFLATEVWERLGISADDGLRDSARSPMLQLFQRLLFAKITPNLRKIGLLTPDLALRLRLMEIGAIAPDSL